MSKNIIKFNYINIKVVALHRAFSSENNAIDWGPNNYMAIKMDKTFKTYSMHLEIDILYFKNGQKQD